LFSCFLIPNQKHFATICFNAIFIFIAILARFLDTIYRYLINRERYRFSGGLFMPLPLGHAAIGLATYELGANNDSALSRFKIFIFISILANLPDLDVIAGLLIKWNGNAFHRGPTHSLAFALMMGFVASRAWKFWPKIPRIKFGACVLIIFSHVLGDLLFTTAPVSVFWPFEVSWSLGYSGWSDVLTSILLNGFQDAGIIIGSAASIILVSSIRAYRQKPQELKIR